MSQDAVIWCELLSVSCCVCLCTYILIHKRIGHRQSARLTGSSESEQWVKTNLTNYLLPAERPPTPPLCPALSSSRSCPLCLSPPPTLHTHMYSHKRTFAHNLSPPFVFAWQKRRITVIDFHVAGTPGKLFEGLCCDEYQIWDQRRKKKKLDANLGNCWPCSSQPCVWLLRSVCSFVPFVFTLGAVFSCHHILQIYSPLYSGLLCLLFYCRSLYDDLRIWHWSFSAGINTSDFRP